MYKCKHCNIVFAGKEDDGILTFRGKMYCKQCEEPVVEVSDIPQNAGAMHGAQATLISNSDNRITTNNYYGGGVPDEQVETPYGMCRKSEAYFCKQCRRWIPVMFFNLERDMCDGCVEHEGVKAFEDGRSLFDVGLYEEAVKEFIKYEPVCKDPKALAQLQNYIGRCYFEQKLWKEAFKYFIKSREQVPDSLYYMGFCFYYGYGVSIDREKAYDLLKKAQNLGCEKSPDFLESISLFSVERSEKFGFMDNEGYMVIPCEWEDSGDFQEGIAMVKDEYGKWGFIDKLGIWVIPCKWENVYDFQEGLAGVEDENGRWGFVDKMGNLVIPCEWENVYDFQEGLARVKDENGNWGFIDKLGEMTIYGHWMGPWSFLEGFIAVGEDNGKEELFDLKQIPCKWEDVSSFREGLAKVKDDHGGWGFFDKTGKVVIPCKWEFADSFQDGLAEVKDEHDKWGFIDKTGKVVIPCKWTRVWSFQEGLAEVKDEHDKWGFIDKTGNVIVPCKWTRVWSFQEGLAVVEDENGWEYYIDKKGIVIQVKYEPDA